MVGAALLLSVALTYRSASNPVVLGRFSRPYVVLLVILTLGLAGAIRNAVRRSLLEREVPQPFSGQVWFDLAVFTLGLGHLVQAIQEPTMAGRLANLNLFGANRFLPAIVEWVSLIALVGAIAIAVGAPLVRRRLTNLVLLGATLACIGLLLEGALRVRTYLRPAVDGFPTFRNEEWRRRYVRTNRDGYRDVDHSMQPGEARRFLVIGDSYAMGWGLDDTSDRFSEQLAGELHRVTGAEWEPITVADSDRDTVQEIEMLPVGLRYCPDLVLLLYVFNDMDYLAPITGRHPFHEGEGVLVRVNPVRLAFANSYFLREVIFLSLRAIRPLRVAEGASQGVYQDSALVSRHLGDLQRFVGVASSGGRPVAILLFDLGFLHYPEAKERNADFARRATESGLPVISLDSAFVGQSFDSLTVNWRDRHPNARAHRLAAVAAAKAITPMIPPAPVGCSP